MSKSNKKSSNKKQILLLVVLFLFVVIITGTNIYDEKFNNINKKVSQELGNIPEYDSKPYVIINNNNPNFSDEYFHSECFELYSDLDKYGRCGVAFANLGKDTIPKEDEDRTSISHIEPTGWNNKIYDIVNGGYLYNRCHLIAHSLSAENANKQNLITGTKYFNTNMANFERDVLNYLKEDEDNNVLYRVTPIFEGDNLIASGVQLEAMSVEDRGIKIRYNVYIYNVQPRIQIDYSNGNSKLLE